jgi:hypothetical protein
MESFKAGDTMQYDSRDGSRKIETVIVKVTSEKIFIRLPGALGVKSQTPAFFASRGATVKAAKKETKETKAQMMADLGLEKVKGCLGGTYYE